MDKELTLSYWVDPSGELSLHPGSFVSAKTVSVTDSEQLLVLLRGVSGRVDTSRIKHLTYGADPGARLYLDALLEYLKETSVPGAFGEWRWLDYLDTPIDDVEFALKHVWRESQLNHPKAIKTLGGLAISLDRFRAQIGEVEELGKKYADHAEARNEDTTLSGIGLSLQSLTGNLAASVHGAIREIEKARDAIGRLT